MGAKQSGVLDLNKDSLREVAYALRVQPEVKVNIPRCNLPLHDRYLPAANIKRAYLVISTANKEIEPFPPVKESILIVEKQNGGVDWHQTNLDTIIKQCIRKSIS